MRAKRMDIAERIADSLLDCGVAQIPLRELAARLCTSDRMLLYYFSDKSDLIRCSLGIVSTRLTTLLAEALPEGRMVPAALAEAALSLLLSDSAAPFMAVWGDLVAGARRRAVPLGGGVHHGGLAGVDGKPPRRRGRG